MVRKYRDNRGVGPTSSRAEARANRKLQLVVSNSFPGLKGKTLIEQMQDTLDETFRVRETLLKEYEEQDTDEKYDECLKSEGKINGMLEMLAIMRSTTKRTELKRSKIRRGME